MQACEDPTFQCHSDLAYFDKVSNIFKGGLHMITCVLLTCNSVATSQCMQVRFRNTSGKLTICVRNIYTSHNEYSRQDQCIPRLMASKLQ
jgi:hypothetical protein